MEGSGRGGGGGSIIRNGVVRKKEGLGFSNPFAFKALQVFTGFGVGCGVGIGTGAPLNLGIHFFPSFLLCFLGVRQILGYIVLIQLARNDLVMEV